MNKYLIDGRKVVVISKLNDGESIVQEVFVNKDNKEVASGAFFTARSLHDEPLISYSMKEEKRLLAQVRDSKAELSNLANTATALREKIKALKEILTSGHAAMTAIKDGNLGYLPAMLSGSIEYVVIDHVFGPIQPPMKFEDAISYMDSSYGGHRFMCLKLISVFGDANGNLEYGLNSYSDGSGSWLKFSPFVSFEDAVDYIRDCVIKKHRAGNLRDEELQMAIGLGIQFTAEVLDELAAKYMASMEKAKTELQDRTKLAETDLLSKHQRSIDAINQARK